MRKASAVVAIWIILGILGYGMAKYWVKQSVYHHTSSLERAERMANPPFLIKSMLVAEGPISIAVTLILSALETDCQCLGIDLWGFRWPENAKKRSNPKLMSAYH